MARNVVALTPRHVLPQVFGTPKNKSGRVRTQIGSRFFLDRRRSKIIVGRCGCHFTWDFTLTDRQTLAREGEPINLISVVRSLLQTSNPE